jgi:hypothetical protein
MSRLPTAFFALLVTLFARTDGRAGTVFTATLTHDQETTQGTLTTGEPRPLFAASLTVILLISIAASAVLILVLSANIAAAEWAARPEPVLRKPLSDCVMPYRANQD